ncbi:MAG: hypothetical protein V4614_10525 [Pseudomonadota bacterium]
MKNSRIQKVNDLTSKKINRKIPINLIAKAFNILTYKLTNRAIRSQASGRCRHISNKRGRQGHKNRRIDI